MTLKFARDLSGLPTQEETLSRSGLEFMQDVLAGTLSGAPISVSLGFWITEVAEKRVAFRGQPEFASLNPTRGVHGGWYGTVLDSCMACAVMTCVPKGAYYTTLEYKVNITRAIPTGTLVEAVGTVQHAGRSTGVATGEIRSVEDGRLFATGSTTCLIMKANQG